MKSHRTILLGIVTLCVIIPYSRSLTTDTLPQHHDDNPPNNGGRQSQMELGRKDSPRSNYKQIMSNNNFDTSPSPFKISTTPSHEYDQREQYQSQAESSSRAVGNVENLHADPVTQPSFNQESHTTTSEQHYQSQSEQRNNQDAMTSLTPSPLSPSNGHSPDDYQTQSTTQAPPRGFEQIDDIDNQNVNQVTGSSPNSLESQTGAPPHHHSQGQHQPMTFQRNLLSSHSAPQENIIRIVVLGRSGSGVSSTIRELIGPVTNCEKPEGTETLQSIYEYTISNIPGTNSLEQIKLVDLPGFIDGRTLEQESQILATLKSYYAGESSPPNFYLVLSRFDDNRIVGVHSLFVQLLKRIELFKNEFVDKLPPVNKMNIIFLLTRLMSETKLNQRKPTDKINTFRRVIEEFSSLPPPHSIVVGENNAATEYNARVEQGYYRLPNKEHYPKNIWEAMINSTQFEANAPNVGQKVHSVLNAIKDNRETEMKCEARLINTNWDEYSSDAEAFLYFLQQPERWTINESEVNLKMDHVFSHFSDMDKSDGVIQKTALQLYLQNANITTIEDIPTSYVDRAAFFQKSPLISSSYPALLLNEAFGLEMPEYIKPLTVGYCYDVLADVLSLKSPFKITKALPSSIGYTVPNFMKCRKFQSPDFQTFKSYSGNLSDYFNERLKYMKFESVEAIDTAKVNFRGRAKDGFNIAPEGGDEIAALSAAKEYRTLKCVLSQKEYWGELDEEFVENINSLQPVDLHKRDSITDWEGFFGTYGTHIVTEGYGGGSLLGSIVGTNVKKVLESRSLIDDTLESILKFATFSVPDLEEPSYGLFGGEIAEGNTQISQLYNLPEAQRDQLLREWGDSLNSNFDMLKTEFTLDRISSVVKGKMGTDKGEMVDQAIGLLLRGELKFKRKGRKGNATTGGRNDRTRDRPRTSPRPPTPTQASAERYPNYGDTATNYKYQDHKEGLLPTSPTHASQPFYIGTGGDGTGTGSSSSSFDQNQTNLSRLFTSQIQNTNFSLGVMEQSLENRRRNDEKRHRELEEFYKRHHQGNMRDREQRKNETLLHVRRMNETGFIRYQNELSSINEQTELGRRETETQIEYIQRMDAEAELRHQNFLKEELERQRKTEKDRKRCSGWRKLSPYCW